MEDTLEAGEEVTKDKIFFVLILVVVEDTLGDGLKNGMENCQPCLNPYYNGIIGGKMMMRRFLSQ